MTSRDRLEERLPKLLDELAAARTPDYFDSMLRQTARTRQRPAWSSLERWLPMDIAARPARLGLTSWRPVVIALVVLAVLLAVSAALFVGSRPRVPAPFGPARNGLVLFSSTGGDIVSVDPASGTTASVTTTGHKDWGPFMAPDGRQFIFIRTTGGVDQLFAANTDGSSAHLVLATTSRDDWIDWAPASDRFVMVPAGGGVPSIVEVATGKVTPLNVEYAVAGAIWRPNTDQLILLEAKDPNLTVHVVTAAGTEVKSWPAVVGANSEMTVSPDGKQLAYHSWSDNAPGLHGRIHLMNLDTGKDTALTPDLSDGLVWETPDFSPDGSSLMVQQFSAPGTTQDQLALLPASGGGQAVLIGSMHDGANGGMSGMFSPDGSQILVHYADDQTTWLYKVTGGQGQKLTWPGNGDFSWQRLAP